MFDFEKPKIEIAEISEDKRYGKFVVEPLERGYGTTLGNSLRRIMLSSLPGAAVSQVKIDGVLHEFSSIPGVKEDVTEIIMNIKSLAIKNSSETNEPKTAYIEFEGEGVITAADIHADSDIEILNPDQVIATLSGGADSKFYMELTITKGRGYISADKNKSEDLPIGVLAVDSIYTPVERVNMTVENTRVGQVTDYDKLTLDVYTNGTLAPDEAVSLAAKVLSEHLNLFIDLSENAKTAEIMVEKHRRAGVIRSFLQLFKESRNQYSGGAVQPHTGRYDESQKSGSQIPGRGSCKTERIRPAAQSERRGLRYRVGGRALQCVPFMQIRGRVSPNGTGPCITIKQLYFI